MRWFVEVSRVGDSTPAERYCLDAKAWQAALQETRKLRGDSGPLSKFSIELLDDGYRAVDPVQKIRYLVNQAPADAELSIPPTVNGSAAHAAPSVAPSVPSVAPAAPSVAPVAPSVAPAAPSVAPPIGAVTARMPSVPPPAAPIGNVTAPMPAVLVPPDIFNVADSPEPPEVGQSGRSPAAAQEQVGQSGRSPAAAQEQVGQSGRSPAAAQEREAPKKPSARPSSNPSASRGALASEPPRASSSAKSSFSAPRPSPRGGSPSVAPAAAVAASSPSLAVAIPLVAKAPGIESSAAVAVLPMAVITRSSDAPLAPVPARPVIEPQAVAAPTPTPAVVTARLPNFEIILSRRQSPTADTPISYRELACAVPQGTEREAVEALLLDRLTAARAELAALPAGKLVQIAIFDHVFEQRPLRAPLGTLTWKDWRGGPVIAFPAFGEAAPPPSSDLPPSAGSVEPDDAQPIPLARPITGPLAVPPNEPTAAAAEVPAAAAPAPGVTAPAPAAAAAPAAPTPAAAPAAPAPAAARTSNPSSPDLGSRSRIPTGRRRAGEDLIGDLFERMHELHFVRDVPHGAEFALTALLEVVPCAFGLVQVFDINKREFVVVRARGEGISRAMLDRTPDSDSLISEVMRRGRARAYRGDQDPRFTQGRWARLGRAPQHVLCGPVRQGGRYLGMIEIADPQGGTPFHVSEINALDYICEQLADFIANRPVVLDSDVVLAR